MVVNIFKQYRFPLTIIVVTHTRMKNLSLVKGIKFVIKYLLDLITRNTT